MVLSKSEVDRSVESILSKAGNEAERQQAQLRISKLYFQVGDFESARKFCLKYLSSKESAPGFKQLGFILEGQGKKVEALDAFIRSFNLDNGQRDIILKVIEMLNQLPLDREKCRTWLEKAEPVYSRNVAVRSLKERLNAAVTGNGSSQIEKTLKEEISKKPFEASLRVRLLRHYMDNEAFDKAYEFARGVEDTTMMHDELDWYQACDELGTALPTKLALLINIDYHVFHLSVVERLCALTIAAKRAATTKDALVQADVTIVQSLKRFDHYLHNVVHTYKSEKSESWNAFVPNMRGQLYFHLLSTLLLRMRSEMNSSRENKNFVNTLLLAAFNTTPLDSNATWVEKDSRRKLCERWRLQACDRLAIVGHVILAYSRGNKQRFMDSVAYGEKQKIFETAFHSSSSDSDSYFIREAGFESSGDAFPDVDMLKSFEKGAQMLNPVDYQKFVWFAQRYTEIGGENGYGALPTMFQLHILSSVESLPFVGNMQSTAPETVCQLDAYAFLYATALCAVNKVDGSHSSSLVAPPSLTLPLVTTAQSQWWEALIRLVRNEAKEKVGEFRRILQRGIETVRLVGAHRMSTPLVVKLAQLFSEKAAEYDDGYVHLTADPFQLPRHANEEAAGIAARAALYWQYFISGGLEADTISAALYRGEKLFDFPGQMWTTLDNAKYREEAVVFLGVEALRAGKMKEALTYFEESKRPEASFYTGLIYRKWAIDDLNGGRPEASSPDSLSSYYMFLEKARDAFHLTLDRLRQPGVGQSHDLNKVIAEVIEDVDDRLSKTDNGASDSKVGISKINSDEFFSTPKSTFAMHTPMKSHRQLMGTPSIETIPRRANLMAEARPSPERLDGQIRALSSAHDLAVQTTMEHYRLILGELKELRNTYVTEMKEVKTSFREKTGQLEDHLKDITKQISDLSIKVIRRSRSRRPSESIANEEDLYEYDDYVEQYEEEENFDSLAAAPRRKPRAPPVQRQTPQQLPPQQPLAYPGLNAAQQMFYPPNMMSLLQDPNFQNQLAFGYGGFPGALPWLQHQQHLQIGLANLQAQMLPPAAQALPAQPPHNVPQLPPQSQVTLPQPSTSATPLKSDLFSNLLNKPVEMKPQLPTAQPKTDMLSTLLNRPVESKMPQNVVISTSVTLPSSSTSAPVLPSVTVPPQHKLGTVTPQKQPNNYQMVMPDSAKLITSSPLDGNATTPVKPPAGFMSNVPEPKFSSVTKTPDAQSRDRNASIGSDTSYIEEEHDPMPDFKPIIPLPEEIQVKTGEEDEEVLFNERAKLFRFVNKEWKERGIGQMKILRHPGTGKTRIVMRREQVLKVCANHPITNDLKIEFMPKSDVSLFWAAPDYSEGEMSVEKFSIRFKTPDLAKQFKSVFENAAKLAVTEDAKVKEAPKKVDVKIEEQKGFGDKFKIATNQWECKVCYVRNKGEDGKCASCGTTKPGAAPASAANTNPAPNFSFGAKPAVTSAPQFTSQPSFSFGAASTTEAKTTSSFMFGTPKATTTTAPIPGTPKTTVSFSFGASPIVKPPTVEPSKPSGQSFLFGTPANTEATETKPTFSFGTPKRAEPAKVEVKPLLFGTPADTTTKATEAKPAAQSTFSFGTPKTEIKPSVTAAETVKATEVKPAAFSFGAPKATETPKSSLFGTPAEKSTTEVKPVFGFGTTANGSFAFGTPSGGTTTAASSIFSPPKFSFGGTMQLAKTETTAATTSTPVASEKKAEPAKPNIFSSFSFGTPKADGAMPSDVSLSDIMQQKGDNTSASTGMLFSSLAGAQTGFKKSEDFKGFPGKGAPVFGTLKKDSPAGKEELSAKTQDEETEGNVEEFEPTAEFKPVIPLPELVEVKTGEEEETSLFSERGLLYRFDPNAKEWKEKGRGDFKVLKHKVTGKVRLLMRREQVLKICCNHLLTNAVQLVPMNNSDKAYVWFAQDYSEGEMKEEKLALKFKFAETAKRFYDVVEKAKKDLENAPAQTTPQKAPETAKVDEKPKGDNWDKFKPKAGSWECPGCLCRNPIDLMQCPACNTMKPGSALATGKFRFDTQPATDSGTFKFGVTPVASVTPSAAVSVAAPAASSFSLAPSVSVGTVGTGGFTFNLKPLDLSQSPVKPSRSANVSVSSENEYYQDDGHGDNLAFEPVIPLPEKVEVKTGEEDEQVFFRHRAKLFRMVTVKNEKGENTNEWKERGLGDIKVLRHKATGKCRLIMRREQIHKVCLNHQVIQDLKIVPTADRKSVIWAAKDFSESHEGSTEKFLLRFKTPDLVQEFLDAVNKALDGAAPPKDLQEQSEEKEVEIVYVRQPTEEEKKRAAELQLPENFFSYQYKAPCPGCIGCDDDKIPAIVPSGQQQQQHQDYPGQEYDEDEDYEDVTDSVLTESFATLSRKAEGESRWVLRGVGNLKITYDEEMYCERVLMPSAEHPTIPLLNVVITSDCEATVNGEEVEWDGYDVSDDPDIPVKFAFRAKLPSHDEAMQFQQIFEEGREMAEKMGLDDHHYLEGDYEDEDEED